MPTPSSDTRLGMLKTWLAAASAFCFDVESIAPASSDASFRRYFRVASKTHGSLIVMDAPPDKEDCQPFITVAAALRDAAVCAPEVLAADLALGFLILTDLGHTTYLDAFQGAADAHRNRLLGEALAALHKIQRGVDGKTLPRYDQDLLLRELQLFPQWYLKVHCKLALSSSDEAMLDTLFGQLADSALAQSQRAVHRDFHSRNLMLMDHPVAMLGNPGVLDFQDAVEGAVTYDVVSLLRDAYIEYPEAMVLDHAVRFWQVARESNTELPRDFAEFWQAFEFMGLQRHLKVLGIFARLSHRDGKHRYLEDVPLVLKYVRQVAARYRLARPLGALLERAAPEHVRVGLTF